MAIKFRTRYEAFERSDGIGDFGESLAVQSEKDACDINHIMRRFEKTGVLPDAIKQNPQYGDFSEVPVYQEALNTVLHAETQFSMLDARIRERFQNDPAKFLEFVHDPANGEEMVKMGLATLREQPAPTPAPKAKNAVKAKSGALKGDSSDPQE